MPRTLIGFKIRDKRRALGITQAALSARLGISASYLNLIESDKRNIGGKLLKRIADELGVAVDLFDGAAERRLVNDLAELSGASIFGALRLDPGSAGDLASQHPQWGQALAMLHRAYHDRNEAVTALSDRLNQDPFLGDAIHIMLTNVAAIRSASEILENVDDLEPQQQARFLSIIGSESARLAEVAQALAAFFDRAHSSTRSVTPVEEVDDFIQEKENYFPALEQAADALRDAAGIAAGPGRKRADRLPGTPPWRIHRAGAGARPAGRQPAQHRAFRHRPAAADAARYGGAGHAPFRAGENAGAAGVRGADRSRSRGFGAADHGGRPPPRRTRAVRLRRRRHAAALRRLPASRAGGALRHRLPVPQIRRQFRAGLPPPGDAAGSRAWKACASASCAPIRPAM